MVIFKESYDLTNRTPTPPAIRFQRERARRRQYQHDKHNAYVRGRFDARKRDHHHDQQYQYGRSGTDSSSQYDRATTGPSTRVGTTQEFYELPSQVGDTQQQNNSPSAKMPSSFGGARDFSFGEVGKMVLTANRMGSFSFGANNNNSAAAAAATTEEFPIPNVSNDSFSTFFNSNAQEQQRRKSSTANLLQRQDSVTAAAAQAVSDARKKEEQESYFQFAGGIPSQQVTDEEIILSSEHAQKQLQPPCGYDCLEDPTSLFVNEKRLVGEDHFEKYNFSLPAEDIRVAATVREFKKLVVDAGKPKKFLSSGGGGNDGSRPSTAKTTRRGFHERLSSPKNTNGPAPPRDGSRFSSMNRQQENDDNNDNEIRFESNDPRDQQHIIEGLMGSTTRFTSPSVVEQETIRILKRAGDQTSFKNNNNNNNNNNNTQQQKQQQSSATTATRDRLTNRLVEGIEEQKQRSVSVNRSQSASNQRRSTSYNNNNQQQQQQQDDFTSSLNVGTPRALKQQESHRRNVVDFVPPASGSVPHPHVPYKNVQGRAIRAAEAFSRQSMQRAEQLKTHIERDPNPLSHRAPFRITGVASDRNKNFAKSKPTAEEEQLESDIQEDIRFFEWRRSAQEHATNKAKVAVTRENRHDAFTKRQSESFRQALSRYEPGALQRAERAIQHRIAHALVSKYGASQFMVGDGSGGDEDVVIPVSYQVCAREATLVAAESARKEYQEMREEKEKRKQEQQRLLRQRQIEIAQQLRRPETTGAGAKHRAKLLAEQQEREEKELAYMREKQEQEEKEKKEKEERDHRERERVQKHRGGNIYSSGDEDYDDVSPNWRMGRAEASSEAYHHHDGKNKSVKIHESFSQQQKHKTSKQQQQQQKGGSGHHHLVPKPPPPATIRDLPQQKKVYVSRGSIESSGYRQYSGSVLPTGRAAYQTDDSEGFVSSSRMVKDEIDAMESRCPNIQIERHTMLQRKESIVTNPALVNMKNLPEGASPA